MLGGVILEDKCDQWAFQLLKSEGHGGFLGCKTKSIRHVAAVGFPPTNARNASWAAVSNQSSFWIKQCPSRLPCHVIDIPGSVILYFLICSGEPLREGWLRMLSLYLTPNIK